MSTPTPNKLSQGRTPSQLTGATPPVSTPFSSSNAAHAAFSPRGPRSSPQQVKKSPATSMLGQLPSGAFAFDSPSTAAALGLAGPDVDDLRDVRPITRDDDRLKRLDAILEILNQKKGLVSEAGLERLAQRNGFDCLPEDYTAPDGRKMRALIIAGSSTQIEIVLDNNIVRNVTLAFPESSDPTSRHMDPASKMLLRDLRLPASQSPLTKSLDEFAANLGRLASLDRLSIMPDFDCRAALVGLYTSLDRLYRWDLDRLRAEGVGSERMASLLAMCTRHGRPAMHPRNQVGLALQYWKERRLIPPASEATARLADDRERIWSLAVGCAPMDNSLQTSPARISDDWISKDVTTKQPDNDNDGHDKSLSLPPQLDWQEPDYVRLPAAADATKDTAIEMIQPDLSTARVPPVIFTATFDPPVVLPQSDWMRLYASAGMETPAPPPRPPTFDQLHFPIPSGTYSDPSERRTIIRRRTVAVPDRGNTSAVTTRTHRNSLFIYKQIYSMQLSEMTFSHPKQLVHMLPCLRQWAFTSTLLSNSFGGSDSQGIKDNGDVAAVTAAAAAAAAASGISGGSSSDNNINNSKTKSTSTTRPNVVALAAKDRLAEFMQSSMTISSQGKDGGSSSSNESKRQEKWKKGEDGDDGQATDLSLDVTLWVHPTPHFQVIFPFGGSKADIMLQILENGVVEVVHENVLPLLSEERRKTSGVTRETLAKVLEHMEDLCKWAEWIRSRLSYT